MVLLMGWARMGILLILKAWVENRRRGTGLGSMEERVLVPDQCLVPSCSPLPLVLSPFSFLFSLINVEIETIRDISVHHCTS